MQSSTYHIGLWNYAKSFYIAANKLRETDSTDISTPVYFLYGHAIELALKSLIIFQGKDENYLRKIGHDLIMAWKEASADTVSSRIKNIEEITQTIEMINPYYSSKKLEYIVTGGKRYPEIIHMHNSTKNLIVGIGEIIEIPHTQINKAFKVDATISRDTN